jgi:hypothetical protein
MSTNGFWTGLRTRDPASQFRFRVVIGGQFIWWAKTCDKPKINIPVLGKDEYYLNSPLPDVHPGEIVDFQPITMTFVDPVEPHEAAVIVEQLNRASNGNFPRIEGQALKDEFGLITISQIDSKGETLERWTLKGAFPTSIDFGSLDYSSSDLVTITMTFEYTAFEVETFAKNKRKLVSLSRSRAPENDDQAKKLDGGWT